MYCIEFFQKPSDPTYEASHVMSCLSKFRIKYETIITMFLKIVFLRVNLRLKIIQ